MSVLAIDPGTERSALVLWDGETILKAATLPNDELLAMLRDDSRCRYDLTLVLERFESYGMPVGREVFETVFWSGRFVEAWRGSWDLLPRRDVKLHLCRDTRAKDANVRQALVDRFGGKASIRKGAVLYGVRKDVWSALAIALTWWETRRQS